MAGRLIIGSYHYAAPDPADDVWLRRFDRFEMIEAEVAATKTPAVDPNDAMLAASGLRVVGPMHKITVDNLDFMLTGDVHGVTIETIWPAGRRDIESARD